MSAASVPEAAVDVYGNACSSEHYVSTTPSVRRIGGKIYSIPRTRREDPRSNCDFD